VDGGAEVNEGAEVDGQRDGAARMLSSSMRRMRAGAGRARAAQWRELAKIDDRPQLKFFSRLPN
jgi:hypothetical protein